MLANIFLVLALGFNGAASISNLSNNQDLSPNFAGFMYGIMNTIGCTSGIIISPMVEEIAGKYGVSTFPCKFPVATYFLLALLLPSFYRILPEGKIFVGKHTSNYLHELYNFLFVCLSIAIE